MILVLEIEQRANFRITNKTLITNMDVESSTYLLADEVIHSIQITCGGNYTAFTEDFMAVAKTNTMNTIRFLIE